MPFKKKKNYYKIDRRSWHDHLNSSPEHSAQPSSRSRTCRGLRLSIFSTRASFDSAAKISFAGTPLISTSLFRFWGVYADLSPLSFAAHEIAATSETRRGRTVNLTKHTPSAWEATDVQLPFSPSFLHQFTKMSSAFASTLDRARSFDGNLESTPETADTELVKPVLSAFRRETPPFLGADSVVETQDDDEDLESWSVEVSDSTSDEQDLQISRCGWNPTPKNVSPAKPLHSEHRVWRTWRATRKLAPWTLASQLQQRNAESEPQYREASSLHNSQTLPFISLTAKTHPNRTTDPTRFRLESRGREGRSAVDSSI